MESAIVIKVKYEDTLRRFNARILNGELELNLDNLKAKILSLFKFNPDTELILTYVDEDDDIVTLGDNDDLRDVVRQSLNPLRITVKLPEKSGWAAAKSSGTSTPVRSPQLSQNLNSGVQEILNSFPEPIRRTVTKIWTDVGANGTPSGQTIDDLVQLFSELGLPFLNKLAEVQAPAQVSRPGCQDVAVTEVEQTVSDVKSTGSSSSKGKEAIRSRESIAGEGKNDKESPVNVNGGVKAAVKQVPGLEALKAALASTNTSLGVQTGPSEKISSGKSDEPPCSGKFVNLSSFKASPVTTDNEASQKKKESTGSRRINAHAFPCYPVSPLWSNLNSESTTQNGETKDSNQTDLGAALCINECPFSGVSLGNAPAHPQLSSSVGQKERRSNLYGDGSGIVFHRGVRCDGCGVHPITGPRFKSKVKEDYDLCSICFNQMGNTTDYIRIDRPMTYRHSYVKGLHDLHHRGLPHARPPPPAFRCGAVKSSRPKLDSRFIQDVNILDGTIMAPLTPFTKIWRMRNNGSVVWPQGAQLVWIGGDKLSDAFSVAIEIPPSGLAVDEELDVAVDFIAPGRPGRYISYWRMASPSGQKFGQRVWVLIQVDASSKEMPYDGFRGFNLNLPPVSNSIHSPEIISVSPVPMVEDTLPDGENLNEASAVHLVSSREKEQEANFPINDTLFVGDIAGLRPVQGGPSSSVSYPNIDLSELADPVVPSPPASTVTLVQTQDVEGKSEVEETLLKDLEEMGFKQVDLNKEILRLNEYDLEKSVDDLCGVSGWDPILDELQEMGFVDKATNTKLLQKNNGSIKRVVMDLLAGEE
ncbi:OLC1v1013236C1 [Oldenlandia corymbosa var. corymbosa]|uniref:OLC1v1013236C1 n=1 Tax=Oldenlandia corymbosa var. corymbosa TaxID=529605 RepID=A0AAV1DXT8_OLDCO|nr:OLC1v1013236C1 [Oldenlandia corymbosa var. corymbosa]